LFVTNESTVKMRLIRIRIENTESILAYRTPQPNGLMEREIGCYWIKPYWSDDWEPARWDGQEVLNIGEEILGFPPTEVDEWGPRIYPPDHKETD
jgi:hypothetical protein